MVDSQIMISRSFKWTLVALTLAGLAFISWPKFELFQCRSVQSEAKAVLNHFYEAEKFYYAYHHSYTSLEMLIQEGLVKSNEKNYTYRSAFYNDKRFEIIATAKNLKQDSWSVNQTGDIRSIINACTL